jgi:hypothetical protein
MIKDDGTIIFGSGTIIVSNTYNMLILQHVEPKQVIGESPEGEYDIIETIKIKFQGDMIILKKHLLSVTVENPIVTIRGYILDFTNYNPTSVNIVLDAIKRLIANAKVQLCA